MESNGFITAEQRASAAATQLGTIRYGSNEKFRQQGGYYMEEVRRILLDRFGEKAEDGPNSVYAGGLWVRTAMPTREWVAVHRCHHAVSRPRQTRRRTRNSRDSVRTARTQPTRLEYQHAVEFGRKIAGAGFMVITGAGAGIMQNKPPLQALDTYLDGFHFYNGRMSGQMEAHHYCTALNEEVFQCAIFDANTANAKLMGVEYIISKRLFEGLPASEKQLWHSHVHEVKSGQLVAPGIPEVAETRLMKNLVSTYGKTWHTWDTSHGSGADASLPLGEPRLAWSFNRDGEAFNVGETFAGLEFHRGLQLVELTDAKSLAKRSKLEPGRLATGLGGGER